MHASLGYPAKTTWLKECCAANFAGFPFADVKYIQKYYPENDETTMGHMMRQHHNICSTKPKPVLLTSVDKTNLRG